MIRCRGKLLRNRENIQSESATKGYVQDINLSQALKQSGRNVDVRKQEEEIVVSVVLIIVRRNEVTAGPHGTTAGGLRLNTVCVPGRAVLVSRSVEHRKKTGCNNGHCESRNGGCELLFGGGAVEHTLNGGPCVPDG